MNILIVEDDIRCAQYVAELVERWVTRSIEENLPREWS
jgi:hypothetical protein